MITMATVHCWSLLATVASGISKEKSRYLISKYRDKKYQQNSCHHCTIQNSHSDSAYSSMYSNSCGRNDDAYLTSSDENLLNELYDADDEIEGVVVERTDVSEEHFGQTPTKLRSETDHLFCFSQSDFSDNNIVYSLDRAMEIIKERPKLTERLSMEDDSDDCFRESEYDVIDTDEDLDFMENDGTFSSMTMPVITVRSYDSTDEGIVEIIAACRKKERIGKVRSLPNMRFPIKKLSTCKRTSNSLDHTNDFKFRNSLRTYNSSDSDDETTLTKTNTFPRRRRGKTGVILHENKTKSHLRCFDIFHEQEHLPQPEVTKSYISSGLTAENELRLGRFQICHIIEHPIQPIMSNPYQVA